MHEESTTKNAAAYSPQELQLRQLDQAHLWHPFTQMQDFAHEDPPAPIIEKAEGNWLIDVDGKRYLDANCGYWCLALGCRPAEVETAIAQQLQRFSHSTLLGLSHRPAIELAARLASLCGAPLSHVFFADSGSEAVEVALKAAYQYQVQNGHPERSRFIALGGAYHGDTLGAVSVGGIEKFHGLFKPLLFDALRLQPPRTRNNAVYDPANCSETQTMRYTLERHAHELAAIVVEPFVQGPGGILPHPQAYLEALVATAKALRIPVIFDEVAVGMGRMGYLFAFQMLSQKPDIVCLAKGLTAGLLPLSATIFSTTIYNAFLAPWHAGRQFWHGHTFTGSALGCAAALAALDVLAGPDDSGAFLKELRESKIPRFWKLLRSLEPLPNVREVRGAGLMAGVELIKNKAADMAYPHETRQGFKVTLAARKRGVNIRALGDTILVVPPLAITDDELDLICEALADAIDEACRTV